MAFKKFCRIPFTDESETSLRILDMFDAVVSEAVDSFESIIGEHKNGKRLSGESESGV